MKKLTHKDYIEPAKPARTEKDVKDKIKTFVGKGSKSYEVIIKEIQKTDNLTNDEIEAQIEEVKLEDDFKKVVEDVEINIK